MRLKNLIAVVLISPIFAHGKGDPKIGETKAITCTACHGAQGVSANNLWPNLAGQKEDYLVKQIRDFKSGARKDPLMSPQAMIIDEADIEHLAAYFSSLK